MLPNEAAQELESATEELLAATEAGLEMIERSIVRRSEILEHIAKRDPASFSPADVSRLRASLENGEAALERLATLRRNAAAEWQRAHRISFDPPRPAGAVSLSA